MSNQPNPFQPPTELGEKKTEPRAQRPRRRVPGPWTLLPIAGLLVAIAVIRTAAITGDVAIENVLTLICALFAGGILVAWFVFWSAYSRSTRLLSLLVMAIGFVLFVALFRIENVSGELIPTFRLRWSKRADQLLERPVAPSREGAGASNCTSPDDFPQFLGKDRSARVDSVELERDWNARPPRPVWRHPIGAGWSAFSTVCDFAVTMEQRGDEEFVTCYEVPTGRLMWAHGTPGRHQSILGGVGPRSTPTLHNGHVYALGASGDLLCLDLATGALRWSDNLLDRYHVPRGDDDEAIAWGRSGSPLIVDDLVVVPAGGSKDGPKVSLAAFRQDTGKLVWESGDDQISYSSPILTVLAGMRQVVAVNEKTVSGYEPQTGRQLWKSDWPGNSTQDANCSQPVPIGGDRLFLSKAYNWGAALLQLKSQPDGSIQVQQLWHDRKLMKTKFTNVVVYQDHVYGLSDGTLECAALDTGKRCWKEGRYAQGQILGVGGVILVLAENGELAMVEASPEAYRELGRVAVLTGNTWNNLCLHGKRLLVRNANEAACYDLP